MNSFTTNTPSGVSNSGFVPRSHGFDDVNGYSYVNFVQGLFYGVMIANMEFTNEYAIVHSSVLEADDLKPCINFGIHHGLLWLLPIEGTPLTYVEVVNPKVSEDLVYTYAVEYAQSSGVPSEQVSSLVESTVAELKKVYTDNVLEFVSALQSLVTVKEVFKPFGVASLQDSPYDYLDDTLVMSFRVSLSKFFITLDKIGLRPIGVWEGRGYLQFENPRGFSTAPLQDVRVNKTLSCIFFKGIHLKRDNIRDYSELGSGEV